MPLASFHRKPSPNRSSPSLLFRSGILLPPSPWSEGFEHHFRRCPGSRDKVFGVFDLDVLCFISGLTNTSLSSPCTLSNIFFLLVWYNSFSSPSLSLRFLLAEFGVHGPDSLVASNSFALNSLLWIPQFLLARPMLHSACLHPNLPLFPPIHMALLYFAKGILRPIESSRLVDDIK